MVKNAHPYEKKFVPNDITVPGKPSILLVTGPNMGGKSTILRQACLNVLLAQVGFFVPAARCEFHACDIVGTQICLTGLDKICG